MKDILYICWALVLGVFALYTGEFVTFVLLGFILLALNNISRHLKDLKDLMRKSDEHRGKGK